MARKTVRVSDQSGAEIADGKGATVRITFADARKGVRELDLTDAEAERLGGRAARRGGGRGARPPAEVGLLATGGRGDPPSIIFAGSNSSNSGQGDACGAV